MANLKDKASALGGYLKGNTETVTAHNIGDVPTGVDPNQWNANPYAQYDYRHTGWQKFLEGLGFRTNYDAMKESMAINAQEYERDLLEKAHNEQYDSASAQAARERAAGVNPDLAGVDSGDSSSMQPDPNAPIAPESSGFDNPIAFGSAVMSGITSLFGLAQSGIGVMQMFADYKSKVLDNDKKKLANSVDALLASSYGYGENFEDDMQRIFGNDKDSMLAKIFGMRGARRYQPAVMALRRSLIGQEEEYKHRTNRGIARTDYYDIQTSPGYSEFSPLMKIVRQELSSYSYEVDKLTRQYNIAKAINDYGEETEVRAYKNKYDSDYYQNMDGARMAQSAMEGAKAGVESTKTSTELTRAQIRKLKMIDEARETIHKIQQRFARLGDEGNLMANIGAIIMSLIETRYLGF